MSTHLYGIRRDLLDGNGIGLVIITSEGSTLVSPPGEPRVIVQPEQVGQVAWRAILRSTHHWQDLGDAFQPVVLTEGFSISLEPLWL